MNLVFREEKSGPLAARAPHMRMHVDGAPSFFFFFFCFPSSSECPFQQ
jgi:hypothetical protein